MPTSERTHRMLLLLIGGGILALVIWGGMKVFSTRFSPLPVLPRPRVRFEAKNEAWGNSMFSSLKAFFTGDVSSGILGKPLPFGGPGGGNQLLQGQVSPLSMLEEVQLGGARAIDLARSGDGSMYVLLYGSRDGGVGSYEIRSYAVDGTAQTFSTWDAGQGDPASVRIAGASDGSVWIGGSSGRVGRCEKDGRPAWFDETATGLSAAVTSMSVDGTGRVWATDGVGLALGGRDAFAPFQFMTRISDEDRRALLSEMNSIPESLRPQSLEGEDGLLRASILPRRLSALASGEMGLIAAHTAFVFPLALQNSIQRIGAATATIPLVFDLNGDLYGRSLGDGRFVRIWATGTSAYATTALPKDAKTNPNLFGYGPDGLFALDYVPTSTVLWVVHGGNWTAKIVAASGTAPGDSVVRVGADGAGNVWAILRQGGLLRIQKGSAG